MANPVGPLSLAVPENTYQDYFSCADTFTLHGLYASILLPYVINPTAAAAPDDVVWPMFSAVQEGVPDAFFCGTRVLGGGRGTDNSPPFGINICTNGGVPESPVDNLSSASKGCITWGAVSCNNWKNASQLLKYVRSHVGGPSSR